MVNVVRRQKLPFISRTSSEDSNVQYGDNS